MGQALKKLGINLEGVHHRALDDAKNIARILSIIANGDLNTISDWRSDDNQKWLFTLKH